MKVIDQAELQRQRQDNPSLVVIDVRLEEDFAAGHLPGAANACVFKVSFLEDVTRLGAVVDQPVVIYGAMERSHESRMAAEKLERAGFSQVQEFRGGLQAWKAAKLPVEGSGAPAPPDPLNGTFSVDLTESRVEWTGRNLLNKHSGTIALKSGHLTFKDNWLSGGDFIVDMNAMTCGDIADSDMNGVLIDHLKSDDFFFVSKYPVSRFQIRQVQPVPNATPGSPNLRITGDFTVRGQMNPLVLHAVAGRTPEGRPAAQAVFAFDRTVWGSIYGSGKFFANAGMHLVNDLVEVQVRLIA
ncbi:MAG TPA: sulfurtransferase [Verrucomicrobiales bacterium]|nr:sulfurtransferase [Verrucomicrobiales bacterium]